MQRVSASITGKTTASILTPVAVADFMAAQINHAGEKSEFSTRVQARGSCFARQLRHSCRPNAPSCIELVAYEVDHELANVLSEELARLQDLGRRSGRKRIG